MQRLGQCNVPHSTWMTTVFRTLKTKTDSPACLESTLFKLKFHTNVTVFVRTCDDSLCHMFVSIKTLANWTRNKCSPLRLARLYITYFLHEYSCRHGNITAYMNLHRATSPNCWGIGTIDRGSTPFGCSELWETYLWHRHCFGRVIGIRMWISPQKEGNPHSNHRDNLPTRTCHTVWIYPSPYCSLVEDVFFRHVCTSRKPFKNI